MSSLYGKSFAEWDAMPEAERRLRILLYLADEEMKRDSADDQMRQIDQREAESALARGE